MAFFVLLVASGLALRAVESDAPPEPAIVLPTFNVAAEIEGYDLETGWRYGSLPGLEVLGKGYDMDFRTILRDFLVFQKALDLVWPKSLTSGQLPVTLVFCKNTASFDKFSFNKEPTVRSKNGNSVTMATIGGRVLLTEDQAIIVQRLAGDLSVNVEMLEAAYIEAILDRVEKYSSPWLNRGLRKTFAGGSYAKGCFLFPALTSDETLSLRQTGSAEDLEQALKDGKFFTLEQLFSAEKVPASEPRKKKATEATAKPTPPVDQGAAHHPRVLNESYVGPWSNECYEFVHLCLFGANGKYRKPFLQLAELACRQPVDETTFRALFGLGFHDMLLVLWRYTDWAKQTKYKISLDKDEALSTLPKIEFRDATDAEFSRIRGDALLADKWRGAHYAFIAAYLRGARDPELLASLGIQEVAFDKDERALKFLEAAVNAHTTRARAYVELARLRCKAALTKPEGEARKLSASQIQAITEPLSIAFTLSPAMPLSYQVLSAMWMESAIRPTAADLSTIKQGVDRFPFDSDLTYNAAIVHLRYGFASEAAALAEFGLRMARNEKDRERFTALHASISHPPSPPPASR